MKRLHESPLQSAPRLDKAASHSRWETGSIGLIQSGRTRLGPARWPKGATTRRGDLASKGIAARPAAGFAEARPGD
jgi:hypothetical protein